MVPGSHPVIPGLSPMVPSSHPVIPGLSPMVPSSHPVIPGLSPMVPGSHPVIPGLSPVVPGSHPVIPGLSPMVPSSHPVIPGLTGNPSATLCAAIRATVPVPVPTSSRRLSCGVMVMRAPSSTPSVFTFMALRSFTTLNLLNRNMSADLFTVKYKWLLFSSLH